ncbi:MAG: ATP-binding cassette domain-containing protein [Bacteroidetes bacterium]|nr:ATP-binding cassette domain-containing protein [Bacteroidota bacterium]
MQLQLSNIGKKYNREWIFRGISYSFDSPGAYAILGNNGSGKSTLLQILSSRVIQSEGEMVFRFKREIVAAEEMFRYFAMAAPYLELIEEFTLEEVLDFHTKLKPLLPGIGQVKFIEILNLKGVLHKQIRYYSSGMKQRVKLALAILSDVPVVLLDEPCSNLDRQGMDWYRQLIERNMTDRLIIVCSNHQKEEISFCTHELVVNDYK